MTIAIEEEAPATASARQRPLHYWPGYGELAPCGFRFEVVPPPKVDRRGRAYCSECIEFVGGHAA